MPSWEYKHVGGSEGTLQEFKQRGERFELLRERAGVLRIQLSGLKEPGLVGCGGRPRGAMLCFWQTTRIS